MSVTMDVVDEPVPGLDADGRPDPAYAARLGLVPAPAGRRSAAFALDALVWVVLAVPGAIAAVLLVAAGVGGPAAVAADALLPVVVLAMSQGLLAIYATVQLVLHGRRALTLGKAAFGLRSVGVARFGPPGFWRVVLRALILCGGQLALPFVGPAVLFSSSGWDPERRGRSWLDRAGRCYVIDVRHGLDPLDARALRHARRVLDAPATAEAAPLPSLASDRGGAELFIPSARSRSGVVSAAPAEPGAWTPPPLGVSTDRADGGASAAPAVPAASAPAPTASTSTTSAAVVLVFDDGMRLAASATGLLGRNPAPGPGETPGQLVPLVDDSMRISKTHAAYGVDHVGFWLLDRSSKNGTFVELPDGSSVRLAPGVRTPVPVGARIALGGRSFTVTMAPGR